MVSQDRDNFVPADINNLNKLKQIMHICIIYLFILNLALFINYSTFSFFYSIFSERICGFSEAQITFCLCEYYQV